MVAIECVCSEFQHTVTNTCQMRSISSLLLTFALGTPTASIPAGVNPSDSDIHELLLVSRCDLLLLHIPASSPTPSKGAGDRTR